MGQDIVQNFVVNSDTSGVDALSEKMGTLSQAIKTPGDTAENYTAPKMESLIHRIERPIATLAYMGVAQQLTDMGGKGESAGMMIEKGLHAAGSALLFFDAPLGIAVIAGTALWEVFEKMANSSKLTKEQLEQLLKTNNDAAESFRNAAEQAKAQGERADVVKALNDQAEALDRVSTHTKDKAKADVDAARDLLRLTLASNLDTINEENRFDRMISWSSKQDAVTEAQKRYNEQLKIYTAALADNAPKANADNSIWDKKHELQLQAYVDNLKLSEATKEYTSDIKLLSGLENALLSTTDAEEAAMLNKQIDYMKKVTDAENAHIVALGATATQEDVILKQMGNAWAGYAQNIGVSLVQGNQSAKQILTQMMDDQLKIVGDGLIKQLTAKATASAADPLTIGVALAEIAAIGAIEALTGAAGSGGASTASAATASSPTTNQVTNVNVNFQGGNLGDPGAIAVIMKGINKQVVQNNGQTVVTNVVGNGPPPPGILA